MNCEDKKKNDLCNSNTLFGQKPLLSEGTVFNLLQNIDEIIPQFLFSYLQQDKFQLIGQAGMHRASLFF